MLSNIINPTFNNMNLLLKTASEFINVPLLRSDEKEKELLQNLLIPLHDHEWEGKVHKIMDELTKTEKAEHPAFYDKALQDLQLLISNRELSHNDKQTLLLLFYAAYHLSFYEHSKQSCRNGISDPGYTFRYALSGSADPASRGTNELRGWQFRGSTLLFTRSAIEDILEGYLARLKRCIGGVIILHQDEIQRIVNENQFVKSSSAKSIARL